MINGHPIAISSIPILNEHQSTTLSSFFCSLLQLNIVSRKKMSTIFFLYFFQNLHGDCSHGRHGRIPIHRPKSYHQDSTSLEKLTKIIPIIYKSVLIGRRLICDGHSTTDIIYLRRFDRPNFFLDRPANDENINEDDMKNAADVESTTKPHVYNSLWQYSYYNYYYYSTY